MKRTRDQALAHAVRPERSVLELLLADEQADDLLLYILLSVGDADFRDFRRFATVCRRLSALANRVLASGTYHLYLYNFECSDGDDEATISHGECRWWYHPPLKTANAREKLQGEVAAHLNVSPATIHMSPAFKLDPADEDARKWWLSRDGTVPPLPSLEAARAHKRERKRAKFEAQLREAAASGLLRSLLQS